MGNNKIIAFQNEQLMSANSVTTENIQTKTNTYQVENNYHRIGIETLTAPTFMFRISITVTAVGRLCRILRIDNILLNNIILTPDH